MAATTKRKDERYNQLQKYLVRYIPTGQEFPQDRNVLVGALNVAVAEWSRPLPPYVLRDNTFLTKTVNWVDDSIHGKEGQVGFDYITCVGNSSWANTHLPQPWKSNPVTRTVTQASADGESLVMYGKARSKFTGGAVDYGETLGGLRQTTSMIRKRLATLTVMSKLVSARNWKRLRQEFGVGKGAWENSGSYADAWLELRFGWQPLVQDIYDSLELRQKMLRNGQRRSARSGLLTTNGAKGGVAMPVFGGKAGISGLVESEVAANLNNVGLANPALTAWQLLPFSFIVDWYLPISQILAGISTSVGMTALFGWRVSVHGTERSNPIYGPEIRTKNVRRTPMVGLGPIFPQLKYYRAVNDEISKVAVAVALLRQSLGEGRKIKRYQTITPRV